MASPAPTVPPSAPAPSPSPPTSHRCRTGQRSWPWWLPDVVLLAVVLALYGVVVGAGLYTPDEAAYLSQARWVGQGEPWLQPYVVPELGPGPVPAPLALSTLTDDGWAAFAKAPAYIGALVVARQVHPDWGPVALSATGLLAAAVLGGRLAQRLSPGSGRVAFWLVGAGSPLLVHAQVVWAHTVTAAACLAGLTGLMGVVEDRRRLSLVVTVAGLAVAATLRAEALLLGPAAAAALGVHAARHRERAGPSVRAALAAVTGSALGYVINEALVRWALGATVPSRVSSGAPVGLRDRVESAWNNVLSPGGAGEPAMLARCVSVLLIGFVVVELARPRRQAVDRGLLWALVGLAAAAGTYGATGDAAYHGLLPTIPLLVVGTVSALATARGTALHLVAVIAGAYGSLVVLASEPGGGGLGWGGRYVMVAAVLVAPVAAPGLRHLVRSRQPLALALVAVAVVVTGAVQLNGVRRVEQGHAASAAVAPLVASDLAELGRRHDLLFTTDLRIGRLAPDVARGLPLLSAGDEAAEVLARIEAEGLERPLVVTLRGGEAPPLPAGWQVTVVEDLRVLAVGRLERRDD